MPKAHTVSGMCTAIIKSTSKICRTEEHFKIENEEGRSARLGNGLFPLVSLGNHSVAKQARILEELFPRKGSRLWAPCCWQSCYWQWVLRWQEVCLLCPNRRCGHVMIATPCLFSVPSVEKHKENVFPQWERKHLIRLAGTLFAPQSCCTLSSPWFSPVWSFPGLEALRSGVYPWCQEKPCLPDCSSWLFHPDKLC